jgi:hypothetical protein
MECIQLLLLFHKQQVMIHILLNDILHSRKHSIKSAMDKINGVKDSFFTEYSRVSDIVVIAAWTEDEVKNKLDELRKIQDVKSVTPFTLTNHLSAF